MWNLYFVLLSDMILPSMLIIICDGEKRCSFVRAHIIILYILTEASGIFHHLWSKYPACCQHINVAMLCCLCMLPYTVLRRRTVQCTVTAMQHCILRIQYKLRV